MLVAEITRRGERSGLGWIPAIVVVLGMLHLLPASSYNEL